MLNSIVPDGNKSLEVARAPLEVCVTDDQLTTITLVLPPLEDILEMSLLKHQNFSIKDFAEKQRQQIEPKFFSELKSLEKKGARFGTSTNYINRLANSVR